MDPHNAFMRFVDSQQIPPKGSNWGYINDPEFDKLATEARSTSDPKELDKVLARINTRWSTRRCSSGWSTTCGPTPSRARSRATSIPRAGTSTFSPV